MPEALKRYQTPFTSSYQTRTWNEAEMESFPCTCSGPEEKIREVHASRKGFPVFLTGSFSDRKAVTCKRASKDSGDFLFGKLPRACARRDGRRQPGQDALGSALSGEPGASRHLESVALTN